MCINRGKIHTRTPEEAKAIAEKLGLNRPMTFASNGSSVGTTSPVSALKKANQPRYRPSNLNPIPRDKYGCRIGGFDC